MVTTNPIDAVSECARIVNYLAHSLASPAEKVTPIPMTRDSQEGLALLLDDVSDKLTGAVEELLAPPVGSR